MAFYVWSLWHRWINCTTGCQPVVVSFAALYFPLALGTQRQADSLSYDGTTVQNFPESINTPIAMNATAAIRFTQINGT